MKLAELLLKEGLVSAEQLQEARAHESAKGGRLATALVRLGAVPEQEITAAIARQYGVSSIDLGLFEVDPEALRIIPAEVCRRYQLLPLSRHGATLTVAMADPGNVVAMDDIKFMTGHDVEPVVASEIAIDAALESYFGDGRGPVAGARPSHGEAKRPPALTGDDLASIGMPEGEPLPKPGPSTIAPELRAEHLDPSTSLAEVDVDAIADLEPDAAPARTDVTEIDLGTLAKATQVPPVVKLANVLLIDALKRGASEIHVEPYETVLRVRFRVDGVFDDAMALPLALREPLISRLKTLSRLDISEKRRPQHGRIRILLKIEERSKQLSFLAAYLPTPWGEKAVLRLLDKRHLTPDMSLLGFEPESLAALQRALRRRSGLLLVAGPPGSGKTHTLYSALATLNQPDTNVMTIEERVPFDLAGVNQVALREAGGLDAATALRHLAGQDPDVVLIAPLRGGDTARLASKLALTGHRVLASVTERDGSGAVETLIAEGAPAGTLARALRLTVAQRLVRRVCADCSEEADADASALEALVGFGSDPETARQTRLRRGRGCPQCGEAGYRGRIGLFETMPISAALRERIAAGATARTIRAHALEEGLFTLGRSGLAKIAEGLTTIDEVRRHTAI